MTKARSEVVPSPQAVKPPTHPTKTASVPCRVKARPSSNTCFDRRSLPDAPQHRPYSPWPRPPPNPCAPPRPAQHPRPPQHASQAPFSRETSAAIIRNDSHHAYTPAVPFSTAPPAPPLCGVVSGNRLCLTLNFQVLSGLWISKSGTAPVPWIPWKPIERVQLFVS